MLVGQGVSRLEQRITDALCRGSLHLKQSQFLQGISRKIGLYREHTYLSELQASFLFKILTSFETGTTNPRSRSRAPAGSTRRVASQHSSPEDASASPQLMRVLAGLDGYTWADEPLSSASSETEVSQNDNSVLRP
jgi:hypothetical protein